MPEKKGVRIKHIAERLGLSSGTVSLVLNGRGDELRISKETQKSILETARKMDYRPPSKHWEEPEKRYKIAVFWNLLYMGGLLGPFYAGFQEAVKESGKTVEIVLQTYEYDCLEDYDKLFGSQAYDGAIIGGMSDKDVAYLKKRKQEIPVVLVNQTIDGYSSVHVNDFESGRKCADLFQENGHKKVGIISSDNKSMATILRYNGLAEGCRETGLQLREEWCVTNTSGSKGGYDAVQELLGCSELPTVLFIQTSRMVCGVLAALRDHQIRIPEQMEVIAYGDMEYNQYLYPTVTTLHVSITEMAENAMRLLLAILDNHLQEPLSRLHVAKLVYGESFRKRNE